MKSVRKRSASEYFAIASTMVYSATLQKALDAVADMPEGAMDEGVITVPRVPSPVMTLQGAKAADISPAQARIAYEAMLKAAA